MKEILKIIEDIIAEKEEQRKYPAVATFSEIINRTEKSRTSLKTALNELCVEKKITFGHTINDLYFKIKE